MTCLRPLGLLAATAVFVLYFGGCTKDTSEVVEKVPDVTPIANAPELKPYVVEFSTNKAFTKPVIPISEQIEPFVPVDHKLVEGKIVFVDSQTNCALWLIQSYKGATWTEDQKIYLYSEKTSELKEMTVFTNKLLWKAYLFSDNECKEPFILAQVTDRQDHHYRSWADELWSFTVGKQELKRISAGNRVSVSPDRKMAIFMKSDKEGFHSMHLLEIASGHMEPIMSLWEPDPGEGISWEWKWSADSKAVNISGIGGGFQHGKGLRLFWRSKDFDFIFMVKEKKMFSIE